MNYQKNDNNSIDLSNSLGPAFGENNQNQNKKPSHNFSHPINIEAPGIIKWIIRASKGLIKNEKQANVVIFCFIVLLIVISLFLFLNKIIIKTIPVSQELINSPQLRQGIMPR